jgi:hypothetical protein
VLQQAGYAVNFDAPPQGPRAPFPGRGRGGRYAGRSLDARHARAAAAQQGAVRDTYAASLHEELR